ncbi:hypothetical protein [Alteromonas oceanisediminis]|uniref:hypothetical protein n=1 Tax=Alteromonas oceanisediminis TaxID=2836180 RepID=UPI001BD940AA|nr:hypothetical protein [Alteromonas oceanisediminis]MBT0588033.1 hypothetical protein [Alteromonas oceanisediminis]
MMSKQYAQHGTYQITIENNRLTVVSNGPFNAETIKTYRHIAAKLRTELSAPWTQIAVMTGMPIFTPEAEAELKRTVIDRQSMGMVACAFVLEQAEGQSITRRQMGRMYDECNIPHVFAANVAEANEWLDAFLADSQCQEE